MVKNSEPRNRRQELAVGTGRIILGLTQVIAATAAFSMLLVSGIDRLSVGVVLIACIMTAMSKTLFRGHN